MPHPLVDQLRFTRTEFMRAIEGVGEDQARQRFPPMNCISWNVGHLAWQEQRYYLTYAQGRVLYPQIKEEFASGAPASTPPLKEVLDAWLAITKAADPWLDALTSAKLQEKVVINEKQRDFTYGNLLLRMIYHYWYHIGENMAIRQMLTGGDLPQFVGRLDSQAPYRPDEMEDK